MAKAGDRSKTDGKDLPTHLDIGTTSQLYGAHAGRSQSAARTERAAADSTEAGRQSGATTLSLEGARDQALQAASEKFKNDPYALRNFREDSAKFERRMSDTSEHREEAARTYQQISRLLNGHSAFLSNQECATIASDVLHSASHPTAANQGNSFDCGAASLSNQIYARQPSAAARAVADVALTGSYTDTKGHTISLDHDTIAIHRTELNEEEKHYGVEQRSHGDQILQSIIRNEDLAGAGDSRDGTGQGWRYEIHKPTAQNPTGETVIDYTTNPPTDRSRSYIGMRDGGSEGIYQRMTGSDTRFSLTGHDADGMSLFQFRDRLNSSNMFHQYPLDGTVHMDREPFKSSMGAQSGTGIDHAITIEGYDPKTDTVRYRNSAFGSRQLTMSARELYDAMRTKSWLENLF
jgi:hypothetical protein